MLRNQLSTGFQLALFWSITPSFSSVVPPFNSTRYADNVWFASRLDLRLLKAAAGREASDPTAVRVDAPTNLGPAGPNRLTIR
jgi:hypothetical protein